MTDERLAELERLCAAATPAPWLAGPDACGEPSLRLDDGAGALLTGERAEWFSKESGYLFAGTTLAEHDDADFIAAARTALPELLAEVRRLRG